MICACHARFLRVAGDAIHAILVETGAFAAQAGPGRRKVLIKVCAASLHKSSDRKTAALRPHDCTHDHLPLLLPLHACSPGPSEQAQITTQYDDTRITRRLTAPASEVRTAPNLARCAARA